jgi:hypothetical protein
MRNAPSVGNFAIGGCFCEEMSTEPVFGKLMRKQEMRKRSQKVSYGETWLKSPSHSVPKPYPNPMCPTPREEYNITYTAVFPKQIKSEFDQNSAQSSIYRQYRGQVNMVNHIQLCNLKAPEHKKL